MDTYEDKVLVTTLIKQNWIEVRGDITYSLPVLCLSMGWVWLPAPGYDALRAAPLPSVWSPVAAPEGVGGPSVPHPLCLLCGHL